MAKTRHPVLRHWFYFGSGVSIGSRSDRWDYQIAARPYLADDGTVCVTSFHYWAYDVYGWSTNLCRVSVDDRKILGRRHYLSGEKVARARRDIAWAPELLKELEELPSKDDNVKARMKAYAAMAADTVPVNDHRPFLPFSRTVFDRYGRRFELRTGPRRVAMAYDPDALRTQVAEREDSEGLFARAELALRDGRLDEAAALMQRTLTSLSSEDVDFRASVNQQLYQIHRRLAQSAIRGGRAEQELRHALSMSRTVSTLAEEIENLFAFAEAYERKGDFASAARCLRSIANTYGRREYPIAPVAEDRAAVQAAAKAMLARAASYAENTIYSRELTASIELARRGLPLYFRRVSPRPTPLTVRAGALAAARLIRLQRTAGAEAFAKDFEALAQK